MKGYVTRKSRSSGKRMMAHGYRTCKTTSSTVTGNRDQVLDKNGTQIPGPSLSAALRARGDAPPAKQIVLEPVREIIDAYLSWGERQSGYGGQPWTERARTCSLQHMAWVERLRLKVMDDLLDILPIVQRECHATNKYAATDMAGEQ